MTETQTTDLVAWLTAIWDEDEAEARKSKYRDDAWWMEGPFDADFVLARIAADRKILELHRPNGRNILGYPVCDACTPLKPTPCPTVRLLASAYADRPGYQEAWRP